MIYTYCRGSSRGSSGRKTRKSDTSPHARLEAVITSIIPLHVANLRVLVPGDLETLGFLSTHIQTVLERWNVVSGTNVGTIVIVAALPSKGHAVSWSSIPSIGWTRRSSGGRGRRGSGRLAADNAIDGSICARRIQLVLHVAPALEELGSQALTICKAS
jgi:hypothetical protein